SSLVSDAHPADWAPLADWALLCAAQVKHAHLRRSQDGGLVGHALGAWHGEQPIDVAVFVVITTDDRGHASSDVGGHREGQCGLHGRVRGDVLRAGARQQHRLLRAQHAQEACAHAGNLGVHSSLTSSGFRL
ncbi:MAG: hypothetical protein ACPIOQ_52010, partial [Promethearchaeia archaeon]